MNPIQMKMICHTCPSKRKVQSDVNDARRILSRVEQLFPEMKKKTRGRIRMRTSYFASYPKCHYTSSSCNEFRHLSSELSRYEDQLENAFAQISEELLQIKMSDERKFKTLKGSLFDLFRGHYPKAARAIMDLN